MSHFLRILHYGVVFNGPNQWNSKEHLGALIIKKLCKGAIFKKFLAGGNAKHVHLAGGKDLLTLFFNEINKGRLKNHRHLNRITLTSFTSIQIMENAFYIEWLNFEYLTMCNTILT
jgi:hypothetical protein